MQSEDKVETRKIYPKSPRTLKRIVLQNGVTISDVNGILASHGVPPVALGATWSEVVEHGLKHGIILAGD